MKLLLHTKEYLALYLSLCGPVNWLLKMVEPLKKYFVDQPKCPLVVLNFCHQDF